MCGISGVFGRDPAAVELAAQAMNRAQAHRGPDDEGLVLLHTGQGYLAVGHRRLAIIDISPAGHQPMEDPETGNWITFNGEIYNFMELRCVLERRGEVFHTITDTEVILKAYGVWGKRCVEFFRGIFAFGLWDARQQSLFLARDQLGVKPLYIWQNNRQVVFASEVRAIMATGLVPRALDMDGLLSYLAYGSVQEPFTLIDSVRSLTAGHYMIWKDDILSSPICYWALPKPEGIMVKEPKNIDETMLAMLGDAVESQLISDVPLGAFLSGGTDSTTIVALMRQADRGTVKTFSVVFQEEFYDERQWSRLAALHIGTDHTELLLTGEDVRAHLPRALKAFDQPSMDGLNTYFVSRAVRNAGLSVALSGVGGDELFGGYDEYSKALFAERVKGLTNNLPVFATKFLAILLNHFARSEPIRKAAELLTTTRHPFFLTRRLFTDAQMDGLLALDIPRTTDWQHKAFEAIERKAQGYDPVNRSSAFELQTYMRSTLLRDTDQMSMAHALEVRVPLLDPKLVEYVFALPGACKLRPGQPKPLLTRPMSGRLPSQCVYRPKQGFELPFEVWLRTMLHGDMSDLLLGTTNLAAWPFSTNGLHALWNAYQTGHVNWSRVWAVFILMNWMKLHGVTG
jgi:asparagine synthase (glutamine-hydrolysing)